jgi:hypothetical protein
MIECHVHIRSCHRYVNDVAGAADLQLAAPALVAGQVQVHVHLVDHSENWFSQ